MIGSTMMVLWSLTLPSLGTSALTINAGTAPTAENYVPIMMVIRDFEGSTGQSISISLGDNPTDLGNITSAGIDQGASSSLTGYNLTGLGGAKILNSGNDLYITYSSTLPYSGTTVTVDILGYPTT